MSSLAFVTHPSVRIKGTENSYTPTQCLDERCPVKAPHLHCPFCVKTDAYQDPVILKAHYRVKHVDKGIEFAGLKILRCCDQCDIIGIIKGEKRFKGAHWHCYRCRNGFNRRDEAIKHYKTHFRNPQTTFQIQITQDLNSPPEVRPHDDHSNSSQDAFVSIENPVQEIIHPALSQTGIGLAEQNVITTGSGGTRHGNVQKIKHELLGKGDNSGEREDQETIMIIQGDQLESAFASHIINSGELTALSKASVDPNLSWEIRFRMEEEEKNIYKSKAEEYKAQVELLQQQVGDLETQLSQQSQLKLQELIESLSSGDSNKQGLGQQLSKFLEQCQLQSSQGSVTVVHQDNSQALHHHHDHHQHVIIKTEEGQELTESADNVLSDQLEAGVTTRQLDETASVTHLNDIPEGFHVLCTTPEGHVVVTRAPDSVIPVSTSERRTIVGSENRSCLTSATVVSTSISASGQTVFTHLLGNKEKSNNLALAGVSGCTEGLVTGSDLSQEDQGDLSILSSGQGCQMEVVAAADGLASLGTDVTVIASANDDQDGQSTFVMDIESGDRIFVQGTEENINLPDEHCADEEQYGAKEPDKKRTRIT